MLQPLGIKPVFTGEFFHEVVLDIGKPAGPVLEKMAEANVLGGCALSRYYPSLENAILVCVTETKNESDLQSYVDVMKSAIN